MIDMKKIIIICLLIPILYLSSFSQVDKPILKGTLLTGGNISFHSEKYKDINPNATYIQNIKNLELNSNIGYFIVNQLSTGIKVEYQIDKKEFEYLIVPDKYIVKNFLIGPTMRYYIKMGLFAETTFLIGFLNSGSEESPAKWRNYSWSSGVGYSIFFNQNIAFEPMIKYKLLHKKGYEIEEGEEVNSGIFFSCGFQIYFDLND